MYGPAGSKLHHPLDEHGNPEKTRPLTLHIFLDHSLLEVFTCTGKGLHALKKVHSRQSSFEDCFVFTQVCIQICTQVFPGRFMCSRVVAARSHKLLEVCVVGNSNVR